jgi:hypothetical protein
MELPGSSYLQTLALISITFGGFAVLVTVFRQMIGGRLSDFDVFFIRNTLLRSFMAAGCSMLPSLLALFQISPSIIWRVSSLITGLLLTLFTLTWYARRRAVTHTPLTKAFLVNFFLQMLTAIFLLVIASGTILEPAPGHFAAAVTIIMVTAVIAYMAQLRLLLQAHPTGKRKRR